MALGNMDHFSHFKGDNGPPVELGGPTTTENRRKTGKNSPICLLLIYFKVIVSFILFFEIPFYVGVTVCVAVANLYNRGN